tara:strand:- start:497 stop:706 length:210 start_codon:yes stop_codon:yes gene_type:complete
VKTISVELKKKTLVDAYNIVRVQRDLGFPAYQKGEPLHDLMMEIKRSINKKLKQKSLFDKIRLWLKKYF